MPGWGEQYWGEGFWSHADAWGARENGDPSDTDSPLIPIAPGDFDAVSSSVSRLWKQYAATVTWPDLMSIIGEAWGELDATLAKVDMRRYRSTAEGEQLELVGELVGRPRGSLVDDEQYRLAILVDAATLFASGTVPELLDLANLLTDKTPEVTEFFPAAYRLRVPDLDAETFALLADLLGDVPAAGVGALVSTYDSEATGGWSSTRARLESNDDALVFWPNLLTLKDRVSGGQGVATGTTYDADADAIVANGTNTYVRWPNAADLSGQPFAVSLWYRADIDPEAHVLFQINSTAGAWAFRAMITSGATRRPFLIVDYDTTDLIAASSEPLSMVGVWHHIVWAYDGSGLASGVQIYVNGIEVAYTSLVNGIGTPKPVDFDYVVSSNTSVGADGPIADVRVFDRVPTLAEVQHVYLEGLDDSGAFNRSNIEQPVRDAAVWSSVYGAVGGTRAHWATARKIGA